MDTKLTPVAELRKRLGMTLAEFAAALELKSRGQASEIERMTRISPEVALRIERLSNRSIDASTLNATVAAARQGLAA